MHCALCLQGRLIGELNPYLTAWKPLRDGPAGEAWGPGVVLLSPQGRARCQAGR